MVYEEKIVKDKDGNDVKLIKRFKDSCWERE